MIDSQLQAFLINKFNPDGSDLRKYQLYLLQMLKDFDRICTQIGVKYWLSSGTLIGAARHGGFIPWDDDIDVEMMKDDYDKLLQLFEETDKYAIQSHENDKYFFLSYAKFRDKNSIMIENQECQKHYRYNGVFIDILKMNMTYRPMSKRIHQTIELLSRPLRYKKRLPHVVIWISKILIDAVFKAIPYIEKYCKSHNYLEFGHDYGSFFYDKKRDFSSLFPLKKAKFEDSYFPVPNDVDSYLSATYEHWKVLPDLENLHSHLIKVKYL